MRTHLLSLSLLALSFAPAMASEPDLDDDESAKSSDVILAQPPKAAIDSGIEKEWISPSGFVMTKYKNGYTGTSRRPGATPNFWLIDAAAKNAPKPPPLNSGARWMMGADTSRRPPAVIPKFVGRWFSVSGSSTFDIKAGPRDTISGTLVQGELEQGPLQPIEDGGLIWFTEAEQSKDHYFKFMSSKGANYPDAKSGLSARYDQEVSVTYDDLKDRITITRNLNKYCGGEWSNITGYDELTLERQGTIHKPKPEGPVPRELPRAPANGDGKY